CRKPMRTSSPVTLCQVAPSFLAHGGVQGAEYSDSTWRGGSPNPWHPMAGRGGGGGGAPGAAAVPSGPAPTPGGGAPWPEPAVPEDAWFTDAMIAWLWSGGALGSSCAVADC